MSNPIFFAPLRVPVTDPNTGLMSRPWYLFFQSLFERIGGSTGPGSDDLEQLVTEDLDTAGIDQLAIAQAISGMQALGADPADPVSSDASDAQMLILDAIDGGGFAANPTAKVGLTAVNGQLPNFMRSDAAPPIDQAITPTWTAKHIFSAILQSGVTAPQSTALISSRVAGNDFEFGHSNAAGFGSTLGAETGTGASFVALSAEAGTNANTYRTRGNKGSVIKSDLAGGLIFGAAANASADNQSLSVQLTLSLTGDGAFTGKFGCNSAAPPAQPTGYGTPTGGAHQASFAAGTITLPNLAAAVAQLIIELKSYGLIGA